MCKASGTNCLAVAFPTMKLAQKPTMMGITKLRELRLMTRCRSAMALLLSYI